MDPRKVPADRILNLNVGVLGHVDSGKTSLVKTLSKILSTAALDKSNQSRQRGITLDLGFSAFLVPLPPRIASEERYREKYDLLQITLVDCPGHASLIRTIIGGAQIIDMVLLVVDATKGIQTQTAECLVIAEMTTNNLMVVLNKVDLFPEEERTKRLNEVERRIRGTLRSTRFADVPMVGVSSCVGGEKVAAVSDSAGTTSGTSSEGDGGKTNTIEAAAMQAGIQTQNIEQLLTLLQDRITPPNRTPSPKFLFAVDHCFPIKGQGTVLTGTCLSGSIQSNDTVEFPTLATQKKIKGMQMFRRKVDRIGQGDRAGICVSNFDPNLMERGIIASPGCIKLIKGALAVVRKVRYFKGALKCGSKFHVSIGHATVMATVTFWGAREIAQRLKKKTDSTDNADIGKDKFGKGTKKNKDGGDEGLLVGHSSLGEQMDGLPRLRFDFNEDFVQQDEYLEVIDAEGGTHMGNTDDGFDGTETPKMSSGERMSSDGGEGILHWCVLDFQSPVYCPLDSLVIGSRLDSDVTYANACRLAFSGRLVEKFDASKDWSRVKLYTTKEKSGSVCRLGDAHRREDDGKVVRYEVYGTDLFKKETNMAQFVGLHVETDRKEEIGVIQSSFGTSGKFRVHFPAGTEVREGDRLFLRFRRYANDPDKGIHQTSTLPKARMGTRIANAKKEKRLPGGNSSRGPKKSAQNKTTPMKPTASQTVAAAMAEKCTVEASIGDKKIAGEIAALKGDVLDNGKHTMAIVSGLFGPEVNIRDKVGTKVRVVTTDDLGSIAGPFGKAGKCKVAFDNGVSAPVGTKVEFVLSS